MLHPHPDRRPRRVTWPPASWGAMRPRPSHVMLPAVAALALVVATLAGDPWDAEITALGVALFAAMPTITSRILTWVAAYADVEELDAGPNTVPLALVLWAVGFAFAHSWLADALWLAVATARGSPCGPVACALCALLAAAVVAIAILDAALESRTVERATHWSGVVGITGLRSAAATALALSVTVGASSIIAW